MIDFADNNYNWDSFYQNLLLIFLIDKKKKKEKNKNIKNIYKKNKDVFNLFLY